MRTNSVAPTSHVAWEHSTVSPCTPVDTFVGCLGSSAKPTPKTYSLAELYGQQNLLPRKTASELISLWQNFKQIDLKSPGVYTRFQAWKHDSSPEIFYRIVEEKMLEEISDRFLSGRSISDNNGHISQLLDGHVVDRVTEEILGRVYKAKCYYNATLSGIKAYPQFDQIFMEALCTKPYSVHNIGNFFEEAREFKIPHKHLFLLLDLERLSEPVVTQLTEEAKKSQTPLIGTQKAKQIKAWATEYNQILENCQVPKANWISANTPQKDAMHGYRLATLKLHPDRNPGGALLFKRLIELAEKLGTKSA